MAWSPISFGLTSGDKIEDTHTMMNKLLHKVRLCSAVKVLKMTCCPEPIGVIKFGPFENMIIIDCN